MALGGKRAVFPRDSAPVRAQKADGRPARSRGPVDYYGAVGPSKLTEPGILVRSNAKFVTLICGPTEGLRVFSFGHSSVRWTGGLTSQ